MYLQQLRQMPKTDRFCLNNEVKHNSNYNFQSKTSQNLAFIVLVLCFFEALAVQASGP